MGTYTSSRMEELAVDSHLRQTDRKQADDTVANRDAYYRKYEANKG